MGNTGSDSGDSMVRKKSALDRRGGENSKVPDLKKTEFEKKKEQKKEKQVKEAEGDFDYLQGGGIQWKHVSEKSQQIV